MGRVLLIEEMLYAIMNDLNLFYDRYKLIRARGTLFSSLYTDCNPQLMLGDMVIHPFLLWSDLRDLHLSSGRCTVWYLSNSKCNRVIDVHELEVALLLVFNYSDPIEWLRVIVIQVRSPWFWVKWFFVTNLVASL